MAGERRDEQLRPANPTDNPQVPAPGRYRGSRLSSDDLVHAERLAGPASDQIDAGVAFVASFMERLGPTEHPQYDIDVVDEAIVNAVAHRDYAIAGSKIRLFLFADRLELYSPGRLPNTVTLADMAYRTFTRNQLLVSFLSRIRSRRTGEVFLESRGEGVRKILKDGEAHARRRPEYELFGDELRLTRVGGAALTRGHARSGRMRPVTPAHLRVHRRPPEWHVANGRTARGRC